MIKEELIMSVFNSTMWSIAEELANQLMHHAQIPVLEGMWALPHRICNILVGAQAISGDGNVEYLVTGWAIYFPDISKVEVFFFIPTADGAKVLYDDIVESEGPFIPRVEIECSKEVMGKAMELAMESPHLRYCNVRYNSDTGTWILHAADAQLEIPRLAMLEGSVLEQNGIQIVADFGGLSDDEFNMITGYITKSGVLNTPLYEK